MHAKHLLKFLFPLFLACTLVACVKDDPARPVDPSGVVTKAFCSPLTASTTPDPRSDPFWDSWVSPQPDKTLVIEQDNEICDPFQKS